MKLEKGRLFILAKLVDYFSYDQHGCEELYSPYSSDAAWRYDGSNCCVPIDPEDFPYPESFHQHFIKNTLRVCSRKVLFSVNFSALTGQQLQYLGADMYFKVVHPAIEVRTTSLNASGNYGIRTTAQEEFSEFGFGCSYKVSARIGMCESFRSIYVPIRDRYESFVLTEAIERLESIRFEFGTLDEIAALQEQIKNQA